MKTQLLLPILLCSKLLYGQWEHVTTLPSECLNIASLKTAYNRVWITTCDGNTYYSDDQGQSWESWLLPDGTTAARMWFSEQEFLAVSNPVSSPETIFSSMDHGNTWQARFTDTAQAFRINNVFSAGGYYFFVNNPGQGWGSFLFRSDDGCKTWNNISVEDNGTWESQLEGADAGGGVLIVQIVKQDGIGDAWFYDLKSIDFGQTWEGYGIPNLFSEYKAVVMGSCWVVKKSINAFSFPIYVSFNAAEDFSQIPADACHLSFAFTPPDKVFSYDTDCIARWNDTIQVWQAIEPPPVVCRKFIQTQKGGMFVATNMEGLWRFPPPFSSTNNPSASVDHPLSLSPNPATQLVEISWPENLPLETLLQAFDHAGKIVFEQKRTAINSAGIDISTWPPGIYLLKAGNHTTKLVKM